jgi:hypothetical protein
VIQALPCGLGSGRRDGGRAPLSARRPNSAKPAPSAIVERYGARTRALRLLRGRRRGTRGLRLRPGLPGRWRRVRRAGRRRGVGHCGPVRRAPDPPDAVPDPLTRDVDDGWRRARRRCGIRRLDVTPGHGQREADQERECAESATARGSARALESPHEATGRPAACGTAPRPSRSARPGAFGSRCGPRRSPSGSSARRAPIPEGAEPSSRPDPRGSR